MQDFVGIVENDTEMQRALEGLETLRERARRVSGHRSSRIQPGWHAALDLPNLLLVSEAVAVQR